MCSCYRLGLSEVALLLAGLQERCGGVRILGLVAASVSYVRMVVGSRMTTVVGRGWIDLQVWAMRRMDSLSRRSVGPRHLATGDRGEREALFHLRKIGYTVVARRWTSAKLLGDIDLVGWDGRTLCFVEVKTRSGRDAMPAESAVDRDKRDMLRKMARAYLRGFPEKLRADVPVRFDVVSVYLLRSGVEFDVYRGAFGW
jgi:putative endonuclease